MTIDFSPASARKDLVRKAARSHPAGRQGQFGLIAVAADIDDLSK